MKNEFKKADSKGNRLSEEIGKGIDTKFCEEVLNQRTKEVEFKLRLPTSEKIAFFKKCGEGNASNVARILFKKYVNGEIE